MAVAITIIIEKNELKSVSHYCNIGEAVKFLQKVRDTHSIPINWNAFDVPVKENDANEKQG